MIVAFALLILNLVTVFVFFVDKQRALAGDWRVAESTLLGLAAIGGSAGAVWARRTFRHKTRKQPFSTWLDMIATLHVGVAAGLAYAFLV